MSQATANQRITDNSPPEPVVSAEATPSRTKGHIVRAFVWMLGTIPTLAVLAGLAAVVFWGHHSGWKIPKFSELTGHSAATPDDWCLAHNVPESECIECIPALLPNQTDYGWCKQHGVHQCPLCHPDVAQLKSPPKIDPRQREYTSLALLARDRQENNLGCTLYRNRVQFASIESVNKSGIDIEVVETRPIVESITASGEVTYDDTRVAHLSTRVPGTIWRVEKNVGDQVRRGDVLALVDAAEMGQAKSELLDSFALVDYHSKTVARLTPLFEKEVITGRRMLEAETALKQANIRLGRAEQTLINLGMKVSLDELASLDENERATHVRFLGLSPDILAALPDTPASINLIPLVASLDGIVIQRDAVPGEVVSPSQMLFRLADTRQMWLRFNVALEDAKHLSNEQPVRFHPDGSREDVRGAISWISTDVDNQTRTVEVRAVVNNPSGTLRNKTFGVGDIILRETADAVIVPREAVQWDGSCYVVFVRDKDYFEEGHPKIFHTRTVRPGVTSSDHTEIIVGVLPGEVVVTQGSSVLRSQILKNNLGAGCTCGH